MAGTVVNIKVCGSCQHRLGLIMKSSEVRHYAYTKRSAVTQKKNENSIFKIDIIIILFIYD